MGGNELGYLPDLTLDTDGGSGLIQDRLHWREAGTPDTRTVPEVFTLDRYGGDQD